MIIKDNNIDNYNSNNNSWHLYCKLSLSYDTIHWTALCLFVYKNYISYCIKYIYLFIYCFGNISSHVCIFQTWLNQICHERGWEHKSSPLVWRELIDRGGKGVLIGGASDFQEYVKGYYGLESGLKSDDMRKIGSENFKTKEVGPYMIGSLLPVCRLSVDQ